MVAVSTRALLLLFFLPILGVYAYAAQTGGAVRGSVFGVLFLHTALVGLLILRNVVLVFLFLPALATGRAREPERRRAREAVLASNRGDAALVGRSAPGWRPVTLETADGVKLDGMEYHHAKNIVASSTAERWIVYMNPNGVAYEEIMADVVGSYGAHLDASVLFFNYRGVGGSAGWPITARDLHLDGLAAVEHVRKRERASVLLYGHSLGGGVAAGLMHHFDEQDGEEEETVRGMCSDRSFSSFSRVAQCHVKGGEALGAAVGAVMGIVVALAALLVLMLRSRLLGVGPGAPLLPPVLLATALLGGGAQIGYARHLMAKEGREKDEKKLMREFKQAVDEGKLAADSPAPTPPAGPSVLGSVVVGLFVSLLLYAVAPAAPDELLAPMTSFFVYILLGEVIGVLFSLAHLLPPVTAPLLRVLGWEMLASALLAKVPAATGDDRVVVLHHRGDVVIPSAASVAKGGGGHHVVDLAYAASSEAALPEEVDAEMVYHIYPLHLDPQFPQVLHALSSMWRRSGEEGKKTK